MSKKRNSSQQTPRLIRSSKFFGDNTVSTKMTAKFLQRSQLSCNKYKTIKTQMSELQNNDKLRTVYNQNISKYRELVNSNDKSLLPFLCSLRDIPFDKNKINEKLTKTIIRPFEVSSKTTCNQKITKQMQDIKGRTNRLTNAFYRWHNKSGSGIKQSCLFQSKLRETNMKFYHNTTFKNLFNPVQYPQYKSQRVYTESQLICSKQHKLFNLQK